jgi:hypothetical protein
MNREAELRAKLVELRARLKGLKAQERKANAELAELIRTTTVERLRAFTPKQLCTLRGAMTTQQLRAFDKRLQIIVR